VSHVIVTDIFSNKTLVSNHPKFVNVYQTETKFNMFCQVADLGLILYCTLHWPVGEFSCVFFIYQI
jgi:hypothetical protein